MADTSVIYMLKALAADVLGKVGNKLGRPAGFVPLHPVTDKATAEVLRYASGAVYPGQVFRWRPVPWKGRSAAIRLNRGLPNSPAPPAWARPIEGEDGDAARELFAEWYVDGDPDRGYKTSQGRPAHPFAPGSAAADEHRALLASNKALAKENALLKAAQLQVSEAVKKTAGQGKLNALKAKKKPADEAAGTGG
ncbi:MAG: hypothetical protein DRQ55_11225 [Planctomycetota bacterium]|nr:MAG: hypothetical protein DRQ55_11225 [Planctomycetota bacterium]